MHKRFTLVFTLLLLALAGPLSAQINFMQFPRGNDFPTRTQFFSPEDEPHEHPVDMQHMRLELRFDPPAGKVMGTVQHTFVVLRDGLDSWFVNAPGITIHEITMDGQELEFRAANEGPDPAQEGIRMMFPEPLENGSEVTVSIRYEATPNFGLYFIGWNDPTGRARTQLWTQGEAIEHRYWIPHYDHQNDKFIQEVVVHFDAAYEVLSNGTLLSADVEGDEKVWHYKMQKPHSSYLLMLGIGKYGIDERTTERGVPLRLYYYPDQPEKIGPTYRYTEEIVDWLSETIGYDYPWESYSQIPVRDYTYGAMENTTATVFGDFSHIDERDYIDNNYVGTNVHEATHQWFGDLVTCESWKHLWLQESFATFYTKLFRRDKFGQDAYQWTRRNEQNSAIAASNTNKLPIVHTLSGSARYYPKGSAVLDMMMHVWGEDAYKRVIQYYLNHHAYKNVETNDLYEAFMDTLGVTPYWFFDQWLYRGGEPEYTVSFEALSRDEPPTKYAFTVEQVHERNGLIGLFKMPIDFEVHYADGEFDRHRAWIENEKETVVFNVARGREIAFVLFDPGSYIIKKVNFEKPVEMLMAQLGSAPMMIDRYDALVALRDVPLEQKRQTLLAAYYREGEFHAVRAEVVRQLANDMHKDSRSLLSEATTDGQVQVRVQAISAPDELDPKLRKQYEAMLNDSSRNVVGTALQRLMNTYPERADRYLKETADESGGRGNSIRITWLSLAAPRGNADAVTELVDFATDSYGFITRIGAMNVLARLNHLDETHAMNLFTAALNRNNALRFTANRLIGSYKSNAEHKALLMQVYEGMDLTEEQAAVLRPLLD